MARDYDSFLSGMRELVPYKLPEWSEYKSEADFGNVLLQLFAHMGDLLSYYQDRIANESFLATAQTRRSIIHHLGLIGYRLATAAPASTTLTLTFDVPADFIDIVTISKGDAFATKSTEGSPSVRFEYTAEQPHTVDCSALPVDPSTNRKHYQGTMPVEEGRLVRNEFLGASDGTPNQRIPLAHTGLILRSLAHGQTINQDLILTSQLGPTIVPWTLQESLAFSGAGQDDFAIEIDENDQATILFGDDQFGRIPTTGSEIWATYRVGGGPHGNVGVGSIKTIADAPQLSLLAAQVINKEAATGGAERESIADAVLHAPSVFRSLKRAVTTDDYEALALEFSGVGKVRAEAANWNTVTLFVAPEGGGQVSDVLRTNLRAYFEDLRPLSTLIEVEDVDYVEIYVTAEVSVVSYYPREQIAEEVREAASGLLAFDEVDFGTPLHVSKFYEAIELLEGVESVFISEFRSEDEPADTIESDGTIAPASYQVPVGASAYDDQVLVIATGGF